MNIKTIKLVSYLVATIFLGLVAVAFLASFTYERFQSWPKAIIEARMALYMQVLATAFFLSSPQKWKVRIGIGSVAVFLCCSGFGLALSSVSLIVIGTIGVYAIMGGYCASKVAGHILPEKSIKWIQKPWLN